MPWYQSGIHPQTTANDLQPSQGPPGGEAHHIANTGGVFLCAADFLRAAPRGLLHLTQHPLCLAAASIHAASYCKPASSSHPIPTVKRAMVPLMVASTTSALFTLKR